MTLAWWAGAGAGLTYWFWQQYLPDREPGEHELAYYLGFGDGDTAAALVELVLGVLVLITLPCDLARGRPDGAGGEDPAMRSRR